MRLKSSSFFVPFILWSIAACAPMQPTDTASAPSSNPQFAFCEASTFANCTIAPCTPKDGGYTCDCFVDTRYSATAWNGSISKSCLTAAGSTAQSRYHPVDSYQECTDSRTENPNWAWCLGVKCTTSTDGSAKCDCTKPPSNVQPFPYVVVTKTYKPEGCKDAGLGKVWSSAAPGDVSQITTFLQGQPGLQALQQPVVILNR